MANVKVPHARTKLSTHAGNAVGQGTPVVNILTGTKRQKEKEEQKAERARTALRRIRRSDKPVQRDPLKRLLS